MLFKAGEAMFIKKIYNIFEANKQGFDGKSCTLTYFSTFEGHMADI